MVYKNVKYVLIGKKEWLCNSLFISAHFIIMEISTFCMALLIFGGSLDGVKAISCKWFSVSCHTETNQEV